jgi:hypothetical protein
MLPMLPLIPAYRNVDMHTKERTIVLALTNWHNTAASMVEATTLHTRKRQDIQ